MKTSTSLYENIPLPLGEPEQPKIAPMADLNVKIYDAATLNQLSVEAAHTARLRKNLNVHPRLADPIQRLFNAMEPGTYTRPHRHARDSGWEFMLVLRGEFAVLFFDAEGLVLHRVTLSASRGDGAVEIPAYTLHCVVSLRPGTLMFEIKPGPYSPVADKEFAAWAPAEGDAGTADWVRWFETAQPGERAPV